MSTRQVPSGDLSRVRHRLRDEIDAAVAGVLDRGQFVLGPELAAFETEFAAAVGVAHAVGVANGTDAIALALRALGVGPGNEVITTPLSAAFSALAVQQIGAVPVFADIDPLRYTLDPVAAARRLGPRTAALLPVHLYGQPAELDALLALARDAGVPLVEDCAQAHGAAFGGRPVGSFGAAAAWSFYPSKNLGAFGDGGAVTTDSAEVATRLRLLRNGGQTERFVHVLPGVNSRLDEVQAAILRVRLRHLAEDNARRAAIAARYTEAVRGLDGIQAPWVATGVVHAWHLYVLRSPRRQRLAAHLARHGVATTVHYPIAMNRQAGLAGAAPHPSMPVAERTVEDVLSLPIFPELRDDEVDQVCDALRTAAAA